MRKFIWIFVVAILLAGAGVGTWFAYDYAKESCGFPYECYEQCEGTVMASGITSDNIKTNDAEIAYINDAKEIVFKGSGETMLSASFGPFSFDTKVKVLAHDYTEKTCTDDSVCKRCGSLNEKAEGHVLVERTCTEPEYCSVCETIFRDATGHSWSERTCLKGSVCMVCGVEGPEALGHNWSEPTCIEGDYCLRCGIDGERAPLGHEFLEATCTLPETCERCGDTRGEALGHKYKQVCMKETFCDVCKVKIADALEHDWSEATCTKASTCSRCGKKDGAALGHEADDPTCMEDSYCKRCEKLVYKKISHNYILTSSDDSGDHYICTMCGKTNLVAKANASDFAWKVLELMNREREANGLSKLTMNQTLCNIANVRAVEVEAYFSHTRPDGTSWSTLYEPYGYKYRKAGENIAQGYPTPESVMDGWMNSPGHRANILNPDYTEVGIGVYQASAGGRINWVQNFGTPR